MYCTNCGNKIYQENNFCGSCGVRIEKSVNDISFKEVDLNINKKTFTKIMNISGEVHGGVSMEGNAYGREEGVRVRSPHTLQKK